MVETLQEVCDLLDPIDKPQQGAFLPSVFETSPVHFHDMCSLLEAVKSADQRVHGFLACRIQARNLVPAREICTGLIVLAPEVDLTDLCISQRHLDLGMAKEFLDGRQACSAAEDFGGIGMP